MQRPTIPTNEKERLASLYQYEEIMQERKEDLQTIVELASSICDMPISLVTVVEEDTQAFVAKIGMELGGTPREHSFCAHAINHPNEPFVVEDVREDERFASNPFVAGEGNIVFYGGVPLVNQDNFAMGTLCVIDYKKRKLTDYQLSSLKMLSKQITLMLDHQKNMASLREKEQLLEQTVKDLDDVAAMIAHDLKSACRRISITTEILQMKHENDLDEESLGFLNDIVKETKDASQFTNDILKLSKSIYSYKDKITKINVSKLIENSLQKVRIPAHFVVRYPQTNVHLYAPHSAVGHIIDNLLQNSVKYMDKPNPEIVITHRLDRNYHYFEMKDNGPGIPEAYQEKIFDAFNRGQFKDGKKSEGSGIGLAIVKKVVYFLGGSIELESKVGEGTTFRWRLPVVLEENELQKLQF